jgi:hypothetical protein
MMLSCSKRFPGPGKGAVVRVEPRCDKGFKNRFGPKNRSPPISPKTVKNQKNRPVFDTKFNFQNLGKENRKPSGFSGLLTGFSGLLIGFEPVFYSKFKF